MAALHDLAMSHSIPTAEDRLEPHRATGLSQRLNGLRAGVLGANDGIVSVAAVVVGVGSATTGTGAILTAGAAALIGGAFSMALGEYVSVSSQKDSEHAMIAKERRELEEDPEGELAELAEMYVEQGLSPETAERVAVELTAKDPLTAHLRMELNLDQDDVASPWQAAIASFLAFFVGALLPLLTMVLIPTPWRIPLTFAITLTGLGLTGAVAARLGGSPMLRAATRVVVGGALALVVTFAIGRLFGHAGAI